MFEYAAAFHVHSQFSDGESDLTDILAAARACDVDAVFICDHNTLNARREGWEGWRGGALVVVGAEIGKHGSPHCHGFRIRHCCNFAFQPPREYLSAIRAQGGFAVAAHPAGLQRPFLSINQQPWPCWDHPALRAFELWSYPHDWVRSLAPHRLLTPRQSMLRPESVVRGPDPTILRRWDRLTRTRRLNAVAGIDCHGRTLPFIGARIFPYPQMFRALRTHILTRERFNDARDVDLALDAVAQGRCFIGHDVLADTRGLRVEAETATGERLLTGDERAFDGPTRLLLRLPRTAHVTLVQDGRARLRRTTDRFEFLARRPGVYRFEATLNGRPWVFTNPFYLRHPAAPTMPSPLSRPQEV